MLPLSEFREPCYWGDTAGAEVYFKCTRNRYLGVAGLYNAWKTTGAEKFYSMTFLMRPACKYVMDKLDMILLMSVNPGFGGQKFIPATLGKVREARRLIDTSGYDIRLEIDGGVTAHNIADIAAAGADTFVAGSAIFSQGDYAAAIKAMRAALAGV